MFTRRVSFNLHGASYISYVVDYLTEYSRGVFGKSGIKISARHSNGLLDEITYDVTLYVKREDLTKCLDTILMIQMRYRAVINNLWVGP